MSTSINPFALSEIIDDDIITGPKILTDDEILDDSRITIYDELQDQFNCISIVQNGIEYPYGTLGNISVTKGKAKSRKTFFASMLTAAVIRNGVFQDTIKCDFPEHKRNVVVFDTEQGRNRTIKLIRRIHQMTGMSRDIFSQVVDVHSLREYAPGDRVRAIRRYLETHDNIGFALIDGIRDLTFDINDSKTAVETVQLLMSWSEQNGIHIHTIIHQNKGDNNAKGHLGSELTAKAETVADAEFNSEYHYTVLKASETRDMEFPDLFYDVDDDSIPHFVEGQKKPAKITRNPVEMADSWHAEALERIFKSESAINYAGLVEAIKVAYLHLGLDLGTSNAKKFLTYFIQSGRVVGVKGGRETHYRLNV